MVYKYFIFFLRSNNSDAVFSAMAAIMILAILESDEISLGILTTLLASVRKENQVIISFSA